MSFDENLKNIDNLKTDTLSSQSCSSEGEGDCTVAKNCACSMNGDTATAITSKCGQMPRKRVWQKLMAVILVIVMVVELGFGGYLYLSQQLAPRSPFIAENESQAAELNKMTEIWNILRQNYYQELTDKDLWEAMITGTAANLGSPFTRYMTKEEVDSFREGVSGAYFGIGATVQQDIENESFSIAGLTPEAPAIKAGLKEGDIFEVINDKKIREFKNATALAAEVKGPAGTVVKIEIFRPSTKENLKFEVVRGPIKTVDVKVKALPQALLQFVQKDKKTATDPKVGYIEVREFTQTLADQFIPALKKLVAEGNKKIILDFRFNPGGDANAMQKCLDAILPDGLIASIVGRFNGIKYKDEWRTTDAVEIPTDVKFAIIINQYSASASEFFSGAMHDRGRAVLVGKQSYGKGVGTQTHYLKDGSALNVTTFEYILPAGGHVEGVGLKPDFEVDLPKTSLGKSFDKLDWKEDTQLQKAVEVLLYD